jgi:hypothetical protein
VFENLSEIIADSVPSVDLSQLPEGMSHPQHIACREHSDFAISSFQSIHRARRQTIQLNSIWTERRLIPRAFAAAL